MFGITAQSESGGHDFGGSGMPVTSPKGAMYAMQVMPGTMTDPGFGVAPVQAPTAAEADRVGSQYLAAMQAKYGGDMSKAWAAYNAGPGRTDAAIKQHGSDWFAHIPAQTRAYIAQNLRMMGQR